MHDRKSSNIMNDIGVNSIGFDMPDIPGIESLIDNPDGNLLKLEADSQPETSVSISKLDF